MQLERTSSEYWRADMGSIIAVHGLGANPDKTWSFQHNFSSRSREDHSQSEPCNGESTMWLRDLLPHHVPNARIMTFNYASEWLRDAPRESMRPLASRLLANIDDMRQETEVSPITEWESSAQDLSMVKKRLPTLDNRDNPNGRWFSSGIALEGCWLKR